MADGETQGQGWLYKPLRSQLEFHADLKSRYKGFSGPVGSGKSYALVYEALFNALLYNPGRWGLIGAPSYPLLRDTTQRAWFETLESEGFQGGKDYSFFKQENRFIFKETKSTVVFRSLDNPESLRGTNLAWFGIDELTYCQEDSFLRLLARLRDPLATKITGFGVWTPKGYDWVYRRFIDPKTKTKSYSAILALPRENVYLPRDFYDSLKGDYSDKFFRQEAEGEYLSLHTGQVYYAFNREENIAEVQFDPGKPICWSLDFNVNPMCSVIAQIHDFAPAYTQSKDFRQVHVLEEISLPDANVEEACREFVRRAEKFVRPGWPLQVYVYGDPAGDWRSHAGPSDYQLIKSFFRNEPNFQLYYRIASSHPAIKERINSANSLLCNAAGIRRLFIHPDCTELRADFEQVTWKQDTHGNPLPDISKSDPKRTHMSDATSYMIHQEFPLRGSVGAR